MSRQFALNALAGSGFRAKSREGHLRMVFHVYSTWGGFLPGRLMGILATHNPYLPEVALSFVTWVRSGNGSSAVLVDVSWAGLAFLRGRYYNLLAFLETVRIWPAEK